MKELLIVNESILDEPGVELGGKESTANESLEHGPVAVQSSVERGSPSLFKEEVIKPQ